MESMLRISGAVVFHIVTILQEVGLVVDIVNMGCGYFT
jgi:hypothetical protein